MNQYQARDIVWTVYQWIYRAVRRVIIGAFWAIEFLLFLRILLVFLRANSGAFVVNKLYWLTGILTLPFQNIFANYFWQGGEIELTSVAAMIGYIIAAFIFLSLLSLFKHERKATINPNPIQYH